MELLFDIELARGFLTSEIDKINHHYFLSMILQTKLTRWNVRSIEGISILNWRRWGWTLRFRK